MAPQTRQLWPLQIVTTVSGRGKSRIYSDVRNGTYPPPVKDGAAARWLSDEIESARDFLVANPCATDDQKRTFVAALIAKRPALQTVNA
jgi:predicted DNA-binding transcriptional regulator AlpA